MKIEIQKKATEKKGVFGGVRSVDYNLKISVELSDQEREILRGAYRDQLLTAEELMELRHARQIKTKGSAGSLIIIDDPDIINLVIDKNFADLTMKPLEEKGFGGIISLARISDFDGMFKSAVDMESFANRATDGLKRCKARMNELALLIEGNQLLEENARRGSLVVIEL